MSTTSELSQDAPEGTRCRSCGAKMSQDTTFCRQCGQVKNGGDPFIGQVVNNRYRVLRRLAGGGMGTVFEVEHIHLRKRFAMKLIRPEYSAAPEFAARFRREAQATSRLSHPNCVQTTDFGETSAGAAFLVMELLEGQPLSRRIEAGLSVTEATGITLQILAGLQHAHQAGVIHRDIKPDNITMVEEAGGVSRRKDHRFRPSQAN